MPVALPNTLLHTCSSSRGQRIVYEHDGHKGMQCASHQHLHDNSFPKQNMASPPTVLLSHCDVHDCVSQLNWVQLWLYHLNDAADACIH
jgi:hypothetical protein